MELFTMESFSCPVCLELPIDTWECSQCGQLFCEKCKGEIIKCTKKCPLCRAPSSFQKNVFCQKIILNSSVDCKYNCGMKVPIKDSREHSYVCNGRTFNCYIEKCNFKGLKNELFKHLCENHIEKLTFLAENFNKIEKDFDTETLK